MHRLITEGEELQIVGIVCPREGASATLLSAGIAYTEGLTHYVMDQASQSRLVQDQLENPEIDVFTGKEFGAQQEENQLSFEDMITIDGEAISSSFGMNINTDSIMNMLSNYLSNALKNLDVDTTAAQQDFLDTLRVMGNEMLLSHIEANADGEGKAVLALSDAGTLAQEYLAGPGLVHVEALAAKYPVAASEFTMVYQALLEGLVNNCVAAGLSGSNPSPVEETVPATEETVPVTEETEPSRETTAPAEETTAPTEEATDPAEDPSAPTEESTEPEETEPDETEPDETEPEVTIPPIDLPDMEDMIAVKISAAMVPGMVDGYMVNTVVTGTSAAMGSRMMVNEVINLLKQRLAGFGNVLSGYMGNAFYVDEEKLASAFQFNMTEEDLRRLMEAMYLHERL